MQNSQPDLSSNRREFLRAITSAAAAGCLPSATTSGAESPPPRLPIGFSLYGMKTLPVAEALTVCSEIGYECVELAVMADWPCAPEKLSADARRDIRRQLNDHHLELAALMENLPLGVDGDKHHDNLDRFKRAFDLSRDLTPNQTPLIETILGGSPDKWAMLKGKFVERLGDWAAVAAEHKAIITIKAHVAGALHLPQDAAELVRTIDSPALQLAFDQSHFQLRDVPMADAWKAMAERTRFVHVKDGRGKPGAFQFLLHGDGSIDYVELFRLLKSSRFSGPVVVEVSGQLSSKPDYDPIAAAKKCWPVLRDARVAAMKNEK